MLCSAKWAIACGTGHLPYFLESQWISHPLGVWPAETCTSFKKTKTMILAMTPLSIPDLTAAFVLVTWQFLLPALKFE